MASEIDPAYEDVGFAEDENARKCANETVMCACGHSLADHRGRVCGNVECNECQCEYFCFDRMRPNA